jgi:UPF0716 protein FxsA
MKPLLIVLFILIVIPLGELFVLIEVGRNIGAFPTIGLAIFTAVLGLTLLKKQGREVISRINIALKKQEAPTTESMEAIILIFCGVLLITPGFITDIIGFLGLIPLIRYKLCLLFLRNSKNTRTGRRQTEKSTTTIEGDYTVDKD